MATYSGSSVSYSSSSPISRSSSGSSSTSSSTSSSIAERWTPAIADAAGGFVQIPIFFLRTYSRLGISRTQATLLIHLMAYKWDQRAPFPSVGRLANELGMSVVQTRAHLRSLEKKGFLRRERKYGRTNRYHFDGLFMALEKLLASDQKAYPIESDASDPAAEFVNRNQAARPR